MSKFESIEKLKKTLTNILLKQRIIYFSAGLLTSITAIIVASILLSLIAKIIILPVAVKISILALAGISTLYIFIRYALKRLNHGSIEKVATLLESKNKALKGRLIAAIQFSDNNETDHFSKELVNLTLKQALEKAGNVDFSDAYSVNPLIKNGRNLIISGALGLAMLLLLPGLFSYSYEVYSNPTEVIAPPLGYSVVPTPGTTEWVKYRDIEIGAAIFGTDLPEKATIHFRMAGGNWQDNEIDLRKQRHHEFEMGDSVNIMTTIRQTNKSFDYYVTAGRVETEIQKIDVVDRPRVNEIKLSIFYPDYTGLEPTIVNENNGSFSAVVGSRVNLQIGSNLPVETATLLLEDSSRVPLIVDGKSCETSLLVDKSLSYYIRLVDHLGEENPDPIEYYITAIPDEYPSIDVLRPGFDVNLSDDMYLPLKVRIFDDFGFSSLVLKYSVISRQMRSEEHVAVLHFSDRIKTEGEIEFNWDMDQLNLFPGDYVSYYFEVADNDRITGPKITKSRQYIARLPSLDELITQNEGQSAKRIINTEQLLKSGRELSERLKKSVRKMKADQKNPKNADWQQQKELENIAAKNEEMMDKIKKMSQDMDKSLKEMSENNLMSREVLEKLAQIQKLFEEVATPEMKEAQRKLMEAMKQIDKQKMEDALKDFEMSQDELLKRLERTLALLKKMQLEQKMEAMLRKVEQLADQQDKMNKEAEKSNKDKLPSLSKTEDEIKKELEAIKSELDELKKLAEDAKLGESPEVKKFSESLEKNDADQNMEKMSKSMNQQNKEESVSQGKKAYSKLLQMLDQMQQELMAMKGGDQEKIKKAMRAALDDANYLSENQEDLLKESGTVNPNSVVMRDLATAQQDLLNSCSGLKNRITELGKESPFVAAELQSLVDKATKEMEMAMMGMGEKKGFMANQNQREAMVKLNKASIRLMESMQQQKDCNKGGSCDKPTQQLQSLCNKQNELNQQTKNQCNKPGDAKPKSGDGVKEYLRLAGEQKAIRKSLEELGREFGNSRQILGRLDDMGKEMKEIEEALANGDVSQEVLDRQVKVYSRMLDASRSLYRRDFSEQRKANTASNNAIFLPQELTNDILNDKSKLEDRLRKYLGENYPPQYEKQIKAYFKALLQLESGSTQ